MQQVLKITAMIAEFLVLFYWAHFTVSYEAIRPKANPG
jgi:hypothetical protein